MSRLFRFTGLVLIGVLVLAAPVSAQTPIPTPNEFTQQDDPVSLIGAYYNAISRGDYPRAYSYWEQAPSSQTEQQFAAGFADTVSARAIVYLPVYVDAGAGNFFASIPTLVEAQHSDGGQVFYAGCFTAHMTDVPVGNATQPNPNWYLQKGALKQQSAPDLTALYTACPNVDTLKTLANAQPGMLTPLQLIQSYFSQVSVGAIQGAGVAWESPAGDLFSLMNGLYASSAADLRLFVNPQMDFQGAAGSVYTSIPALLIESGFDNMTRYVTGCYVARVSNITTANEPAASWHFDNLNLSLTLDAYTAVNTLAQGCPQ